MLPNLASLTADVGKKYTINMAIAERNAAERKLEEYRKAWDANPAQPNSPEWNEYHTQVQIMKSNIGELRLLIDNWEMPLEEPVILEPTVN